MPGPVFAIAVASNKQDVSAAAPKAHWHTQELDFGETAVLAGGRPEATAKSVSCFD